MADNKMVWRGIALATILVGLSAVLALPAQAGEWEFTLHGVFNATTSGASPPTETLNAGPGGTNILTTPNEPFTLTGVFNNSSPNLIAGLPFPLNLGWVDYAPSSVTLTVGGTTYSVATYDGSNLPTGGPGLTVAIFDDTTVFSPGPPPFSHFAAGFIQNPLADGAGIVGDWTDLSPGYTIPNLVTTTYPTSDFYGVGFSSGPCSQGFGPGGDCLPGPPRTVVPIPLDGGEFSLTFTSFYDLNNPANSTDDPTNGPFPNPISSDLFFSAQLTAVPESSTWALLLVGFLGLGIVGLRGVRTGRPAA
jgi:hypothetical protein